MPRRKRQEEGLALQLAAQFENLPARTGVITSVVLSATAWILPILVPREGFNLAGSLAYAGSALLWGLAALILISSAFGAARRRFDKARFDSTSSLDELTWAQFEGYLAEYFRRRGSTVTYRGGSSADGGVDLVLDDASGRRIVQAKHWKTRSVGVVILRALWGVLDDERARGAICVSSGDFTPDAVAFAKGKNLELIDGQQLRRLIAEVKRAEPASAVAVAASTTQPAAAVAAAASTAETCPLCGRGVLAKRQARRGPNAGGYFMGCSRFPECRFTRAA